MKLNSKMSQESNNIVAMSFCNGCMFICTDCVFSCSGNCTDACYGSMR
ncbi:hypothetical protein [Clostridium gasigenes]|uniref:Uncharacterized protein n=1 Tax=Clostridium gasigenes TaxID=94869 RepID=A0A1H0NVN6_9CLOT|nr:hypothetical protein [Clostridium gasigenes]MBU3087649.1 hypothetical protein [Clostridium gasigenes]SDO96719.1 hypothetical protein SAMN04488529_101975 [Clostridium gasigenes]